jgi:peptidyl-prolyl cis-trans isomerase A (cyclophilin A)
MKRSLFGLAVLAVLLLAAPWGAARAADETAANPLLKPADLNQKAPEVFKAKFETSKGDFVIEVTRKWAPNGADRFYNLVKNGYFNDCRFFRNIAGFMVQFGINGDPTLNEIWKDATITDDPVVQSNTRGMVTYAKTGQPNSRTTQLFINFVDTNNRLDGMGFAPFGKVAEGMAVVDSLYSGYGEGAPRGQGPDQGRIQAEGNAYLNKDFPKLDFIKKATVLEGAGKAEAPKKEGAPKPAVHKGPSKKAEDK